MLLDLPVSQVYRRLSDLKALEFTSHATYMRLACIATSQNTHACQLEIDLISSFVRNLPSTASETKAMNDLLIDLKTLKFFAATQVGVAGCYMSCFPDVN